MTLYLLFAGLGALAYLGAATVTIAYSVTGAHLALAFTVVFLLWIFDVGAILLSVARHTYTWVLLVALGLSAAIAVATAGTRKNPADVSSAKESGAIVAGVPLTSARLNGERLFNELGCVGCHATGIGPELANRFGSPVESGCGGLSVDDAYIRESILNPTAVVVAGFSPVMPSFAAEVSESDLSALVAYVSSLRTPVNVSH